MLHALSLQSGPLSRHSQILLGMLTLAQLGFGGICGHAREVGSPASKSDAAKMSLDELIVAVGDEFYVPLDEFYVALDTVENRTRVVATAEIFRRDKEKALAALKNAGAVQVAPDRDAHNTRRLDIVYSLLQGLTANRPAAKTRYLNGFDARRTGYRTNSFALRTVQGTSLADVEEMAVKYGFKLVREFRADANPSCYVRIADGNALADVMKRILTEEPRVLTLSLSYFSRFRSVRWFRTPVLGGPRYPARQAPYGRTKR